MSFGHYLLGWIVNLVPPLMGLIAYLKLCRVMRKHGVPSALYYAYFFIFYGYGGWLMVVLTTVLWEWSGLASLGFIFLMAIMPLVMIITAMVLWFSKTKNRFSRWAFWLCAIYAPIEGIAYVALYLITADSRG